MGMGSTASSPPPERSAASDEFMNESSSSEAQSESSYVNSDSNAGHPRRPAWNRPINGDVEAGAVMGGAVSWPSLSESTRPVPRSLSDSTRPVSDGSASSSQAPLISQPPQRQANAHTHANSSTNNTSRPRSRNRGGGGGSSGSGPSHNTFTRPSLPAPLPFHVYDALYRPVPPMLDTPLTGTRPGVVSSPRSTSRRGNYGPRPHGDRPHHHNNYGGRRHQDRRDVNIPPPPYMPSPPMGYMPSPLPPGVPPFMAPPPSVRVFPGQMGFEMASPFMYLPPLLPESFRAMPIVPPPPPLPMISPPANENTLTNMIVKQIDYYFSDDNLAKDNYLRSKMDDHGWVPITLVASFHRVEQLTKDIHVILDALRHSTVVELQGERIRRHVTWKKWLHSSNRPNPETHGVSVSRDDSKNNTDIKDAKD